MIYYGAAELADSFRTVRKNTIQIARDIPEGKYSFAPVPDTRSVEKLLTHIALGYRFQYHINGTARRSDLEGFDFMAMFQDLGKEEAQARDKAAVIALLEKEGEIWVNFVAGLSENFLAETVKFPQGATPQTRSRFALITSVKEHEMHHRGQLMLVERILGIVPHLTLQMQERMTQAQARARSQLS
jgi:uncharacterized damage-inducible protein DinB